MILYIAAPYELHRHALAALHALEARGHAVTSSWLRGAEGMDAAHAQLDLDDVARAEVLLALNPAGWERSGTGGRHAELGYALALGKRIVLIGVRSHIFHYHARVEVLSTLAEFLEGS